MKRLLACLVWLTALCVLGLAAPTSASAAVSSTASGYTYDAQCPTGPPTCPATERGPPTNYDDVALLTSLEPALGDVSGRPVASATPVSTIYDYTVHCVAAEAGCITPTEWAIRDSGVFPLLAQAGVAANGGDESPGRLSGRWL